MCVWRRRPTSKLFTLRPVGRTPPPPPPPPQDGRRCNHVAHSGRVCVQCQSESGVCSLSTPFAKLPSFVPPWRLRSPFDSIPSQAYPHRFCPLGWHRSETVWLVGVCRSRRDEGARGQLHGKRRLGEPRGEGQGVCATCLDDDTWRKSRVAR